MTTGEIMGWLNSDDLLINKSLFTLADIFSNNAEIDWVQGNPCVADESGRIVSQRRHRSSKYQFYLRKYREDGIFIQQESTYWRRGLWERSGASISTDYNYAGDFELWMRYYNHAVQYTTTALVGAFRVRKNQLSEIHYEAYLEECDSIIENYTSKLPADEVSILKKIIKAEKRPIQKRIMSKIGLLKDQHEREQAYSIEYNYEMQKFSSVGKPLTT